MGMFDYVDYNISCKKCGCTVDGFQSKDGPCELKTLPVTIVKNFYSSCPSCGTWVEVTNVEDTLSVEFDEFTNAMARKIKIGEAKLQLVDSENAGSRLVVNPIDAMELACGERVVCSYYTLSDIEAQAKQYGIDIGSLNDKKKDLFMDNLNNADEYLNEYNFEDLVKEAYNGV